MYPRLYTGVAKEVSETWQSRACTHLPAICVRFNITLSLHGLATMLLWKLQTCFYQVKLNSCVALCIHEVKLRPNAACMSVWLVKPTHLGLTLVLSYLGGSNLLCCSCADWRHSEAGQTESRVYQICAGLPRKDPDQRLTAARVVVSLTKLIHQMGWWMNRSDVFEIKMCSIDGT